MRRMKTKVTRPVESSSSSSDADISLGALGASQEEAPTPPGPSSDAAFQRCFTSRKRCAFAVESIYPQVRGTVEGRSFNVSLLRF